MKYKRILLKLSGEALQGKLKYGIDPGRLNEYATEIKQVADLGVQVGIVIGGGNIFRGLQGTNKGFDRVKGDQMGMLATVINSMAIQGELEKLGTQTSLFSSHSIESLAPAFNPADAILELESGKVVLLSGGTGNPYFTTDTASALRALEIKANVILKGTRVDGVYSADPEKFPEAIKFDQISFEEAYEKGLKIMDLTAFTLCMENKIPIVVFDMNKKGNLTRVVNGAEIGTIVK